MPWTTRELRERIRALPRVRLAPLPTPLERCPRLSGAVGTRIWVKRDDLTGLAFGGNKTRHLEFILGRALARASDCIITMAGVQSNQCRQTAAAARRLGLDVHLFLRGAAPRAPDGNLLLDRLLGAELHFVPESATAAELDAEVAGFASTLRTAGRRPYVVDLVEDASPDQELAAVSYALMVAELTGRLAGNEGAPPDRIYLSSGSGASATAAGTWLGCRALGLPTRVIGVAAAPTRDSVLQDTLDIARRAAVTLDLPEFAADPGTIEIERGFVGEGYGHATPEGLEAMRLAARTEGLVLDPVYTGKALAALIAHARAGRVTLDQSVVFVHTGGTPLVFLSHLAEQIGAGPPGGWP